MQTRVRCLLLCSTALAWSAHAATPTTTVLTASASSVLYGQPLVLTATVSPSTATGEVTFFDGISILETETVTNGIATLTVTQLAQGNHSLTAQFVPASAANGGSKSQPLPQTITTASSSGFAGASGPPESTEFVAIGDFNGDAKLDLISITYNSIDVSLGDGNGHFAEPVTFSAGVNPNNVAVADFNGDGKADVVAVGGNGNATVLFGNGNGTFQEPLSLPISAFWVAVGDFNGDGVADLALESSNGLNILLGIEGGTFQSPVNYPYYGNSIVVGDFNGDGIADLATPTGSGVGIFLGKGDGTFAAPVNYPVPQAQGLMAIGDFNGDGKTDLAVPGVLGVAILLGNGDGTFQPLKNFPAGFVGSSDVAVADFNGDGKSDLAVIDEANGYYTPVVYILYGNGDGTFQEPASSFDDPTGYPTFAAVGQFNGDGTPDLALATLYGPVGMLLGQPQSCLLPITPNSVTLDANGGSQVITVPTNSSGCVWTVSAPPMSVQLSSSGGTGSGQVTVTVPPNTTGMDLSLPLIFQGASYPSQEAVITERFEVQTFTDVPPTADYFDAVELLAGKGITSGCTATLFCPTDYVTRAEMAIFIVRAVIGGDNFTYTQTPYYTDVAVGAFGFQWIQKLTDLGITTGCGPMLFCPDDALTRAEAAIFIIRARYGATFSFSYPTTPYFTDVPANAFGFSWIQKMAAVGITTGCTSTTFCPSDPIIRGDMATFIMRGEFNDLLPAGEAVITSISPTTIAAGSSGTYTLTGSNTNFTSLTTIGAMPGITVADVTVASPTSLSMQLTAATNAVLQPVSPFAFTGLQTGTQEAVLPNGLVIR